MLLCVLCAGGFGGGWPWACGTLSLDAVASLRVYFLTWRWFSFFIFICASFLRTPRRCPCLHWEVSVEWVTFGNKHTQENSLVKEARAESCDRGWEFWLIPKQGESLCFNPAAKAVHGHQKCPQGASCPWDQPQKLSFTHKSLVFVISLQPFGAADPSGLIWGHFGLEVKAKSYPKLLGNAGLFFLLNLSCGVRPWSIGSPERIFPWEISHPTINV